MVVIAPEYSFPKSDLYYIMYIELLKSMQQCYRLTLNINIMIKYLKRGLNSSGCITFQQMCIQLLCRVGYRSLRSYLSPHRKNPTVALKSVVKTDSNNQSINLLSVSSDPSLAYAGYSPDLCQYGQSKIAMFAYYQIPPFSKKSICLCQN